MVISLQSGLILSTLLLWTSQQVGTTFGRFTSVREDNSEIKACRVFPSQIESQLSLLAEHLEQAASLKGRLMGASGFEVSSRLESATADLSERIGELNTMIQQLEQQKALNQSIWQELLQELAASSALIHELLTSLDELEPNCAQLSQTTLLDRITDHLKRHRLLSDPLSGTLQEILNYLRSVHQLGLMTFDSFEADSNAAFTFAQPFDGQIAVDGDPVGGELLAYFESVQASLQSSIAGLTADISSLEAQRGQRLTEIGRLKKLKEEQAKQEEQAGEDETAVPDEDENPSNGETPADGKTPTVGGTGRGDVRTPADGAPTGGGDSADKDEDEDKQGQADSADADAAPSSANESEGGE
ncbi:hypothetical protein JO375_01035 [Paenibacillus sp. UY79]|nr:hypothetical protein [Paenibacillus farraposensis]